MLFKQSYPISYSFSISAKAGWHSTNKCLTRASELLTKCVEYGTSIISNQPSTVWCPLYLMHLLLIECCMMFTYSLVSHKNKIPSHYNLSDLFINLYVSAGINDNLFLGATLVWYSARNNS